MNIGNPKKVYTVEPVADPVPRERPDTLEPTPAKTRPAPVEQPAHR